MNALPDWAPELARRLMASHARVSLQAIQPLAGGACQDNFSVDVTLDGTPTRMALRSDARSSLPGSLSRSQEAAAIEAAVAAGVPTPAVRYTVNGLLREGATAYLMDWANGVAIAAKVLRDPRLEAARAVLPGQLASALATIHTVAPSTAPGFRPTCPQSSPDGGVIDAALRFTRHNLDTLPDAYPAMELGYRWLSDHRPAERDAVLAHGDFRMGNFLVGPEGLTAVLDWEFAHWGSPATDLGWLFVRDWRFGRLDKAAGGLVERATFLEAYAKAGGPSVTAAEVHWWEVLGNLRWAAGAAHQTQRVLSGAEADLELLVIGRRACEMSYEALRLIDLGAH